MGICGHEGGKCGGLGLGDTIHLTNNANHQALEDTASAINGFAATAACGPLVPLRLIPTHGGAAIEPRIASTPAARRRPHRCRVSPLTCYVSVAASGRSSPRADGHPLGVVPRRRSGACHGQVPLARFAGATVCFFPVRRW